MGYSTAESNCRKCSRITKHDILYVISTKSDISWFNEQHTYQTLQCRGCENIGFRYKFEDFDDIKESNGKTTHLTTHQRYPTAIAGHRELNYLYAAPELIRKVYRQTITAYAGDALILAGIGFRATIEAVCNHLEISGNSLEKRIDQLFKGGHISSSDKRRLHAIRFLGNDAAHEIREPKKNDLRVALDIVEHLINSVFILEHRAKGLDVQIERFEDLVPVLEECSRESRSNQPQSLSALLGRHKRRLGSDIGNYESLLVQAIDKGVIKYLEIGEVEESEGKPVQLFRILKHQVPDDIPF